MSDERNDQAPEIEDLPLRLKEEIESRKLTISGFSREAGVPRSMVSSVISGKLKPGPAMARNLTEGLMRVRRTPMESGGGRQAVEPPPPRSARSKGVGVVPPASGRGRSGVIGLDATVKLLLDHFGEEAVGLVWDDGVTAWTDGRGNLRQDGGRSLADQAWSEHILGLGYQMSIGCRSGRVIGVAAEGTFVLAARSAGKGFWTLPPCSPDMILESGGAVFRLAPVADNEEIPPELHARFSGGQGTGETAGDDFPAQAAGTEPRISSGEASSASPDQTKTMNT